MIVVAFSVALLGGGLASCTPDVPQAVLHVPGTVRVDYFGASSGTVVMCLDRASAVAIDASWPDGPGAGVPVVHTLRWNGTTTLFDNHPVITPVLQPGCGTLTVGNAQCSDCGPLPNYVVLTARFA